MGKTWKVLIVDDDKQIHLMTSLVLQDIIFQNKAIEILNAYSAEEAKTLLIQDRDIALVLMDVVMETEYAGLELVKFIRDVLKNMKIRIILRTGQPGSAPEKKIIIEYDINDYKEKTELTFQKLFTTVISSLRTYDYISQLESQRGSLEKLIELNTTLFSFNTEPSRIPSSLNLFFRSLILDEDYPFIVLMFLEDLQGQISIYEPFSQQNLDKEKTEFCLEKIHAGLEKEDPDHYFSLYFRDPRYRRLVLFLEPVSEIGKPYEKIYPIFMNNLRIAFSNISLQEEILETQKDITTTLSEFMEKRSSETALHVLRVTKFCGLLGQLAGLDGTSLSILEIAAPMHDLGKVGITDEILKNSNSLTTEQFEQMKKHTFIGYDILNKSNRRILKTAAVISLQHHEHWDGKGYPHQLKGEEIHIMSRIVTLSDVFDALNSKRSYKEAWPDNKIIDYLQENRGKLFDPRLTDLFLQHYQDFKDIALAYPD